MLNQLLDKIIFLLGVSLFISDLLFPLWMIGIIIFLKKKGYPFWKAWIGASTFCLGQAYLVAKFIGYNIGAYTLIWTGSLISTLFYDLPPGTTITSYLTPFQLSLEFWVAPPIILIILPAIVFFIISKLEEREKGQSDPFWGQKKIDD